MKLNTTKRSIKAQPLSHQEFDANWQAIEDIINSRLPSKLYQFIEVTATRIFDNEGIIVTFHCKINVIETLAAMPILKAWATLGSNIIGADVITEWLETNSYPITSGTIIEASFKGRVYTTQSEWPWPVTVYMEDGQGNYAQPLTFTPTFEE